MKRGSPNQESSLAPPIGRCIYNSVILPPKIEGIVFDVGDVSLCDEGAKCAVYRWQCDLEKSQKCKDYGMEKGYVSSGCFAGARDTFNYLPAGSFDIAEEMCGPAKQKGTDCQCIGDGCTCPCTCLMFKGSSTTTNGALKGYSQQS